MTAETPKQVTFTLDGAQLTVPRGTLIIRAAEQAGVYIPRFCDHPLLDPLGACRQCLVEVEGQRKPLTACTTPVAEGMVVKTQRSSELARDAQEGVLELLLINHPLDCPMCDKGGECPLQDQALAYGPGGSRFIDPKRRFVKPIAISPLVRLDRERCVLCARCTRFADEISGDPFIELYERGALEQVAVYEDEPYRSVFSGNVIQICPVGALTSSTFRFRARPFDMTSTPGTCNRCASGCSIDVHTRRGEIMRILARPNDEVNDEWICDKGRFASSYVREPERVTEPLVRKNGDFVAVSWVEAARAVAERIDAARSAGRPIGVLGGQQLADEDSYALSRFARTVLGTNDVDARRHRGTDEEDAVLAALLQSQPATNADVDAARVVALVGTDLRQESPIAFLRVRRAARNGARIFEIGPRRSELPGAAWIPCAPGGEAGALFGLARALERLGDSGLDPWTRAAAGDASEPKGVDETARALTDARGSVVVLAGERLATVPGALSLAWNVAVAFGRFGWIPRKGGARGALWAGLHPRLLPGGRRATDDAERAAVEAIWGVVPEGPGRDAQAILGAASDLGMLFLVGSDPGTDLTDPALGARGIDAAPFVVALDLFRTPSSERADVILPAAAAYEREGTVTNWEGRAQPTFAAVPAAGLSQPDLEILAQIAAALDRPFPATLPALRREMSELATPAVPARAVPVPAARAPEAPEGEELALATGPMLIDGGTMMAGADLLAQTGGAASVALHPEDLRARDLSDGDLVRVSSRHGELVVGVRADRTLARGSAFMPSVQGDVRAAEILGPGETTGVARIERTHGSAG